MDMGDKLSLIVLAFGLWGLTDATVREHRRGRKIASRVAVGYACVLVYLGICFFVPSLWPAPAWADRRGWLRTAVSVAMMPYVMMVTAAFRKAERDRNA